jgi:hypothetical protein
MSHDIIIHCGTAGDELGDKSIVVYDASILSFAVKFDAHALADWPGVSPRDVKRIKRVLEHGYARVLEELEELGVPYIRHEPHPQNL